MALFVIALLSLTVLCLSIILVRRAFALRELSRFVRSLSQGNLDARLFPSGAGDLGKIASDIVSTMEQTRARLDFAEAEMHRMEAILRGMSDGVLITDTR
ncbi:MAG: hypothetical protein HGA78_05405, partial [Nitrospirales bacterium]|nr:hypothetical protein [Nitrospirales bacterium]